MRYIYLHGFASSPQSTKARYFADRFSEMGLRLEVPNLAPVFESMTLSSQLEIVRRVAEGASRVTLLGSSMGGYLSALLASSMPEVEGLVLLAPAFGLAERWETTLGGDRLESWRTTGKLPVYHYGDQRERQLGYAFVTDAAQYPGYPEFSQRALILHGERDEVVPVENSIRASKLGPDRQLRIFNSGHEMTDVLPDLWKQSKAFLTGISIRS